MDYRDASLYQNRLRDEVLYLHGLWKQGPPGSSASHNHNPSFNLLGPRSSVKFKKDKNHRSRKKTVVVSEKEWPTNPSPNPNTVAATGWSVPPPKRTPPPPSAENVAVALAVRVQRNGVEACKSFFSNKVIDEEGDEVGDREEDDGKDEEAEKGAFTFFMEMLKKDDDLRKYYEENHEKGVFPCLVCEGSGVKKGRTFTDCSGLVQHCRNVSKTGWKASHRGLTRALCRVIGWNFDRLPLFVLDLEETLGQTLAREASRLQMNGTWNHDREPEGGVRRQGLESRKGGMSSDSEDMLEGEFARGRVRRRRKNHKKLKKSTMKLLNKIILVTWDLQKSHGRKLVGLFDVYMMMFLRIQTASMHVSM